ncbi:MAG: cytochrome c oxidase subunit 4 [Ilumatobacteraceae bacterium]
MKIETLLWVGVTVFYAAVGVAYMLVGGDPAGVSILFMATGLGGLIAGWTWDWGRRHGERVEDRPDTDAADNTGVVGVYPTESLRPVALAIGATALLAGIPLGSWLSMVGLAIIASQVMLLVRDLDT